MDFEIEKKPINIFLKMVERFISILILSGVVAVGRLQ